MSIPVQGSSQPVKYPLSGYYKLLEADAEYCLPYLPSFPVSFSMKYQHFEATEDAQSSFAPLGFQMFLFTSVNLRGPLSRLILSSCFLPFPTGIWLPREQECWTRLAFGLIQQALFRIACCFSMVLFETRFWWQSQPEFAIRGISEAWAVAHSMERWCVCSWILFAVSILTTSSPTHMFFEHPR